MYKKILLMIWFIISMADISRAQENMENTVLPLTLGEKIFIVEWRTTYNEDVPEIIPDKIEPTVEEIKMILGMRRKKPEIHAWYVDNGYMGNTITNLTLEEKIQILEWRTPYNEELPEAMPDKIEPTVGEMLVILKQREKQYLKSLKPSPFPSKPPSRIGGSFGLQLIDADLDNGIGFAGYYHQTLSRSWFASINIGYNRYLYKITDGRNIARFSHSAIPISAGLNLFFTQRGIRPYLGIEAGYLSSKNHIQINHNNFSLNNNNGLILIFPIIGFSLPVLQSLAIEGNVRFLHRSGLYNTGINVGVAYLIP